MVPEQLPERVVTRHAPTVMLADELIRAGPRAAGPAACRLRPTVSGPRGTSRFLCTVCVCVLVGLRVDRRK